MTFDTEEYFTTVDVKHYAYCPMIVYFTHVLHLEERITESMIYGAESHDESIITPIAASLKASKIIRGLELVSDKLKVRGKLDYLVITKYGELIPVEVKWAEPERGVAKRDHKLQLATYALMLEETFGKPVKRVIAYYTRVGKLISIPLDESVKKQVKHILASMERIVSMEEQPKSAIKPSRCINCGFKSYCRPGREE
ncbi:MAG: CRISPR-associated protein Cas4 [Ignisphaera sp.]